jgi:predicted amidophosphoribosyltransferase
MGNVDPMLQISIACGVFVVVIVICMAIGEPKRDRLRRKLDQEAWMLCPLCEQSLRSLDELPNAPGMVRCPECGQASERNHLPEYWKERLYPKPPDGFE